LRDLISPLLVAADLSSAWERLGRGPSDEFFSFAPKVDTGFGRCHVLRVTQSLVADAATGGQNLAFAEAVAVIQTYTQLMITASVAPDEVAAPVINAAKTNAAQWYDEIYPTYLDMPSTIVTQGDTIDSDLTTLIEVAEQYASAPSDPLHAAIEELASRIEGTVASIRSQTSGLSGGLMTFASNLQVDAGAVGSVQSQLTSQWNATGCQLSAAMGQLHHLEQATCPDNSAIAGCQQLISTLREQFASLRNDVQTVGACVDAASDALSGLSYLGGFWEAVTADAQACVDALAHMQTDPGSAVATDLQRTEQLWSTLREMFDALTAQTAAE
jgi:hypothetical protein